MDIETKNEEFIIYQFYELPCLIAIECFFCIHPCCSRTVSGSKPGVVGGIGHQLVKVTTVRIVPHAWFYTSQFFFISST